MSSVRSRDEREAGLFYVGCRSHAHSVGSYDVVWHSWNGNRTGDSGRIASNSCDAEINDRRKEIVMEDLIVTLFLMVIVGTVVGLIAYYATKGKKQNDNSFAERYNESVDALTSRLGKKIVEVKLLGAGSTDYRSFGGAVVGGMVAGPIGAVIGGAHGGKGKQRQRFAVKYDDGSVVIKEVRVNSREYNELMKYVSWEDIQ